VSQACDLGRWVAIGAQRHDAQNVRMVGRDFPEPGDTAIAVRRDRATTTASNGTLDITLDYSSAPRVGRQGLTPRRR
jgi:hypothetical protein